MQINPSEISELIKSKIQNLQVAAEKRNEGTVISVTDGICRIHGLADVMQGEMLDFPGGAQGLAPDYQTAGDWVSAGATASAGFGSSTRIGSGLVLAAGGAGGGSTACARGLFISFRFLANSSRKVMSWL